MRRRDIKPGMLVYHARSGKDMGVVTTVRSSHVAGQYPPKKNGNPGERWIANPSELEAVPVKADLSVPEPTS
jgi:hypothetical protein